MEILLLDHQGLKEREIAGRLGISRNTVRKYKNNPELIGEERHYPKRSGLLDEYEGHIRFWLEEDAEYKAAWIYDHLQHLGFTGSYEIVKRRVRELKEERQQLAYMRFETDPGRQCQVDFGEFQVECSDGRVEKYYLFSMILGYSRKMYGELLEKCDLPTFPDCHIRAFDYFKGVPEEILYDRMKNVYIRRVAGKDQFNDTLMGFALHYGFKPSVTPPYSPWVKGKVERPYQFIREGFWRGYGFICLERCNQDLQNRLKEKDRRVHGTTHEVIGERFEREQPYLNPQPVNAFDTSRRVYRKVYKDCTVRFEGNSYTVPHRPVGREVLLRFKEGILRIFHNDQLAVSYETPEGKGHPVQNPSFYKALKEDREMNRRKYGHHRQFKGRAKRTVSPSKPLYDMDVEVRPVDIYDHLTGEAEA